MEHGGACVHSVLRKPMRGASAAGKMVYRGGCGSRFEDERASPSLSWDRGRRDLEHRGRSDQMAHFVGLDVSVKETSVYVVDDVGNVILEQKVATEPDAIIALLTSLGETYGRIGIEAGRCRSGWSML
jgi:hypothetical protein